MNCHLVHRIRPWLFALPLGLMLCFFSSPVAADFSLRCVAASGDGDTSQAKARGYRTMNGSNSINNQPAGVLCAAWYDLLSYGRARTMQAACVVILIGIFVLRKTNYR